MRELFSVTTQIPTNNTNNLLSEDEYTDKGFVSNLNNGGSLLRRKSSTFHAAIEETKDSAKVERLSLLDRLTCYDKCTEDIITERLQKTFTTPIHEWSALQPQPIGKVVKTEPDDPFYVVDVGSTVRQYDQWRRLLPKVQPYFAMKCNPDPVVVSLLAGLGCGFDCASKGEIEQAMAAGVPSERIIYANPCKQMSHLQYAQQNGVTMMTFDNADELRKAHSVYGVEARMVLRIVTDDRDSVCQFSSKFGASFEAARELLLLAKELGVQVIGVSFHVGSGCCNPNAFTLAIKSAHELFEDGRRLGFEMSLLDIGGGFPGANSSYTKGLTFVDVAATINDAVNQYFDDSVTVIAEPGRYFVSAAFTLCVNVTSRRVTVPDAAQPESRSLMYYVNDGLYGSFNCVIFDHATVTPKVLVQNHKLLLNKEGDALGNSDGTSEKRYISSLWGPTCDSMDLIAKNIELPELQIGDWLYFENMGAYTCSAASQFNGFQKSAIIYTNTECDLLRSYFMNI